MSVRDVIQAAAGVGGAGAETDPYFANTTLLLQGDVSNPDLTYNAFSDASGNDVNITPNGDARGSSFSPYNTSWGVEFPSGAHLNTPAINFGTNAFTIEGWFNYSQISSGFMPIFGASNGGGANPKTAVYFNSNSLVLDIDGSGAISIGSASSFCQPGKWFHLALVRNSSGATAFFVDGVRRNTPVTVGNRSSVTAAFAIARTESGLMPSGTTAYFSNFHVVNGDAIYDPTQSSITVPTAQLTNTTNTVLRTCMSNRFIDISPSPVSVTPVSNPKITGASPFLDTDTTTGSGYFDGGGDFIGYPADTDLAFGTGDYTVECWVYFTAINSTDLQILFSSGSTGDSFFFHADGNQLSVGTTSVFVSSQSATFVTGTWYHVAACRSGGTLRLFQNGVQVGSDVTDSTNWVSTGTPRIGANGIGTQTVFGYISNSRVVKGTALYTSNFTPSTSPPTAIANTSLLTCQTRGAVRNIGFRDESEYNHLITKNGNCAQGTFSPFSQEEGKWSNYFDGTGDYLSIADSADFDLTGDFTIQCWINPTLLPTTTATTPAYPRIFSFGTYNAANSLGLEIDSNTSGAVRKLAVWYNGSQYVTTSNNIVGVGTWHHIAVVRSGTTITVYRDGTAVITITGASAAVQRSQPFYIGSLQGYENDANAMFSGYISGFSLLKGTAINFAATGVPTSPLSTSTTNQKLLTCYGNRFADFNTATTAKTISVNGSTSVQPFSPFSPSAAYDPDVNGGSVYFDGSDYLTMPAASPFNLGTDDFTIDFWAWLEPYVPTGASTYWAQIIAINTGASDANTVTGSLAIWQGDGTGTGSVAGEFTVIISGSSANQQRLHSGVSGYRQWTHVALTRQSGTFRLYQNGVLKDSASLSANINRGEYQTVGKSNLSFIKGYISSLRIIKGSAIDFAVTGVSTAPPTPTSNTSLLLNFTNAGVIDATGRNVIETEGNAHVETSVKKYGTGSMEFDGSGDYASVAVTPQTFFGAGDFTIECWVNPTSLTTYNMILGYDFPNNYWSIRGNGVLHYYDGAVFEASTGAVPTGSWTHIAVSRQGSTLRQFVNGSLVLASTTSTSFGAASGASLWVGASAAYANQHLFSGRIDDFRMTKGVARYTANFTPPDKSLPNQ